MEGKEKNRGNYFGENSLIIGTTEIANSANIKKVGDNRYVEELGDLTITYYYDGDKNLMIEWKKLKMEKGTKFKEILEKILPTIKYRVPAYIKCDVEALQFHDLEYDKAWIDRNNLVRIRVTEAVNTNNFYSKESNKFGAVLENDDGQIEMHLGVDFSYGRENVTSCMHPPVYSPVDGIVEDIIENKVVIKQDSVKKTINGKEVDVDYYHSLEHFHEINKDIPLGTRVSAGETMLGLMGGTRSGETYRYFQHVHYDIKMKDIYFTGNIHTNTPFDKNNLKKPKNEKWRFIDPEKFWDKEIEVGICDFENEQI